MPKEGENESKRATIVCTGNELRGDDGIALRFYDRLKRDMALSKKVTIIKIPYLTTLKPLETGEKIIVVDAVDFGGKAGEVKVFRPEELCDDVGLTHRFEPSLLIKALQETDVVVVGIQPKNLEVSEVCSKECLDAYEKVREVILKLLE